MRGMAACSFARWRRAAFSAVWRERSEEHTSELQSQSNLVCRLLLEKKKNTYPKIIHVVNHYSKLPDVLFSHTIVDAHNFASLVLLIILVSPSPFFLVVRSLEAVVVL